MATYSGAELEALMSDLESDLVERKESAADGRKIRRNVCAFANDLPESTPQARASSSEEGVEGIEGMALPVYVGKMIYVSNWAASPAWGDLPGRIDLDPDFLLGADDLRHDSRAGSRVVFRDISNSTNERCFRGCFLAATKTPVLDLPSHDLTREIELGAFVTSLVFDWAVRQGMSGTTLNWHIVESLALSSPGSGADDLDVQGVFLSGIHFAGEWLRRPRLRQ